MRFVKTTIEPFEGYEIIYDPYSEYGFISKIVKTVTSPFKSVTKAISDVTKSITKVIGDVGESVFKVVGDVGEGIIDVGGDVFKIVGEVGEGVIDLTTSVGEQVVKFAGDVGEGVIEITGEVIEETYKLGKEAVEMLPKTALYAGIAIAAANPGAGIATILSQALSKGLSTAIVLGYLKKKREEAYEKYRKELERQLRKKEIGITFESPLWFILQLKYKKDFDYFRQKGFVKSINEASDGLAVNVVFKGLDRANLERLKNFLTRFAEDAKRLLTTKSSIKVEIPVVNMLKDDPKQVKLTDYDKLNDVEKAILEFKQLAKLGLLEVGNKSGLFVELTGPRFFVERWKKLMPQIKQTLANRAKRASIVVDPVTFKVINTDARFKQYVELLRTVVRIKKRDDSSIEISYPLAYDSVIKALVEAAKKIASSMQYYTQEQTTIRPAYMQPAGAAGEEKGLIASLLENKTLLVVGGVAAGLLLAYLILKD